jgi:hypothetical protein
MGKCGFGSAEQPVVQCEGYEMPRDAFKALMGGVEA